MFYYSLNIKNNIKYLPRNKLNACVELKKENDTLFPLKYFFINYVFIIKIIKKLSI